MNLWLLQPKINSTFYRLQVWMVAQEVATVVVTDIRITTRTIDPLHPDIRHY